MYELSGGHGNTAYFYNLVKYAVNFIYMYMILKNKRKVVRDRRRDRCNHNISQIYVSRERERKREAGRDRGRER